MKCLDANVATHCEEGATTSTTFFDYFELSGSFNTTYIYPQVSQLTEKLLGRLKMQVRKMQVGLHVQIHRSGKRRYEKRKSDFDAD